ncbi:MAG: recombinase family protein, partial [Bacteroidales bacterium]|nr:recombinase family protein [Bacteroidales bacterium]
PYGYANKRTGKHECWIEFDPKEAPFVTEAFHRVAYGVESPTVVWRDLRSRGMKVSESTFFRILRNRFYIGQVFVPEYGDSPEQYVKGKHQALTDAKSFYLVQDRLDGNRDKAEPEVKKVPDETFFMRSFLRCPHCGQTVYGSFSKGRNKRYAYYHCNYCGKYRIAAEDAKEQPMDKEVEEKMKFSLSFIENMGSCVAAAPIHLKLNILGSIFNGKIVFENSEPRTATLSPLVSLIVGEPSVYKTPKRKQPSESSESCSRGG